MYLSPFLHVVSPRCSVGRSGPATSLPTSISSRTVRPHQQTEGKCGIFVMWKSLALGRVFRGQDAAKVVGRTRGEPHFHVGPHTDSPARDWHLRLIKKCAKFKILAAGGKDGTRNAGACIVQIRLKSGWISTGRIPSLNHIPIRHHAWSTWSRLAEQGAGGFRVVRGVIDKQKERQIVYEV